MSRRLPSLNALKAFEAAARHQSLTAAATELSVTHASVSRHVRALEEWLGTELFTRSARGVALTPEGRQLGVALVQPFDRIAVALKDVGKGRHSNSLRISVEPAIASRWLVPRLGRFKERYPDIELAIAPSAELADLAAGEADFGIRYGPGAWAGTEVVKLTDSWSFPVCSPTFLSPYDLSRPFDMSSCPLLVERNKQWWIDWLAGAGLERITDWNATVFEAHLAIEAAEAGQGFALGDFMLVTDALIAGRLIRPFDLEQREEWGYYLVHAREAPANRQARAFREWLIAEVENTIAAFSAHRSSLSPSSYLTLQTGA
ncbi:transcriptional regulator GcvA [Mesorhizobium sp. CN2-181]|uniref:transcriptional regulator GcvA n=1 Tax=Mesorhizobium yinganensis TaxID=3157707 RepID=UPI0032B73F52